MLPFPRFRNVSSLGPSMLHHHNFFAITILQSHFILPWSPISEITMVHRLSAHPPNQYAVGLRVPASEEETGMDRTRHSFATGGGHNGMGAGGHNERPSKQGSYTGSDAVRRAVNKAQYGFMDDTSHGGVAPSAYSRSQHSSRAGSLSTSKHGDLAAQNGSMIGKYHLELGGWGGGAVAQVPGGGLNTVANAGKNPGGAIGGVGRIGEAETHGGSTKIGNGSKKRLFPLSMPTTGTDGAGSGGSGPNGSEVRMGKGTGAGSRRGGQRSLGLSGGGPAMAAEAVTPSVGRSTPAYAHAFGDPYPSAYDRGAAGMGGAMGKMDDHEVAGGGGRQMKTHWPKLETLERKRHRALALGVPVPVPKASSPAASVNARWQLAVGLSGYHSSPGDDVEDVDYWTRPEEKTEDPNAL